MTATLAATTAPLTLAEALVIFLDAMPVTLADHIAEEASGGVTIDGTTATCDYCGSDIGTMATLAGPFVDFDRAVAELEILRDDHLAEHLRCAREADHG